MTTAGSWWPSAFESDGVEVVFGSPARRQGTGGVVDPLRADETRAGRVVHGRDVRPRHGTCGRGVEHAGPGRHRHPAGCRRCDDQQHASRRDLRAGRRDAEVNHRTGGRPDLMFRRSHSARRCPRPARYPRCSERLSRPRSPAARAVYLAIPEQIDADEADYDLKPPRRVAVQHRRHHRVRCSAQRTCCGMPNTRWCWRATVRHARRPPRPASGWPNAGSSTWPTPSTARA